MELALITAQQVAVLFLLIGTGMVAVKTGVLKLENKQALSNCSATRFLRNSDRIIEKK